MLSLAELERWLVVSTSSYHESLHSSLGQSPAAKWSDSVTSLQGPSPVVVTETAFVVDFLPVIRRRLTRTGFTIDHVQYFSNTLKPWISRREQLGTFVIRRDPRDISRIWVLQPDSGAGYVEVPYRTLSHPAVTLWEHAATARLRERGRTQIDEGALLSMIEQMREITTGAKKATHTARRNRARRQHLPPGTSMSVETMSTQPPDDPLTPDDVVAAFDDIEQW